VLQGGHPRLKKKFYRGKAGCEHTNIYYLFCYLQLAAAKMLCSVFGCNCNSSKNNGAGKIHFYRFPHRETSPDRFKKWTAFCKRKQFVPGKSSMICSKHFSN